MCSKCVRKALRRESYFLNEHNVYVATRCITRFVSFILVRPEGKHPNNNLYLFRINSVSSTYVRLFLLHYICKYAINFIVINYVVYYNDNYCNYN